MHLTDRDEFCTMLQEMASMHRGVIYNDYFADAYWKILKSYSMEAVRRAALDILGNELRKAGMPSPAEIKMVARKFEPKRKPLRVATDEERWRRQYDVWQRSRFSAEGLKVVFMMTDEELGCGAEGEETYIRCQDPGGCEVRVPWPSEDNVMHCRVHRSETGKPVTRAEKLQNAEGITPKARAYLREMLPQLMEGIPVTEEERKFHPKPRVDLPPKLLEYIGTVDPATAEAVLANYTSRQER